MTLEISISRQTGETISIKATDQKKLINLTPLAALLADRLTAEKGSTDDKH